jgi:hypothetical protein
MKRFDMSLRSRSVSEGLTKQREAKQSQELEIASFRYRYIPLRGSKLRNDGQVFKVESK